LKCWKTCGFAVFHSISHPSEPSPHTIPVGHRPLPGVSADFRQGSFSGFGGRQEPHVICEFPVFLVRNAGFRRGGAQESLFSRMGTPLDFSHGGPTGGSPGARGRPRWARVAARWWAHFGPFVAHLTRSLYHSLRALGLDRLSHLQVCRVCRRDPFPQKHACSMLRVNGTYPTTVLRHALRPAMARSWGACGRTTLPSQPATAIRRWLPAGHGGRGLGTCGASFGAACVPYVLV